MQTALAAPGKKLPRTPRARRGAQACAKQPECGAPIFQRIIEASVTPTIVFDCIADDQRIVYANPAFKQCVGHSIAGVLGRDWRFLCGKASEPSELRRARAAIRDRAHARVVLRSQHANGRFFWNEVQLTRISCVKSARRLYLAEMRDITVERLSREELEWRAHHDALTGLPNRHMLEDRLRYALGQARRQSASLAVLLIDVDQFKRVNDSLGHLAGDELLRQVAARLKKVMRTGDTVARLGGDEFVLLLQSARDRATLSIILERLRNELRRPATLHGRALSVSCSIGVGIYPTDGRDAASLLCHADNAMYQEKSRKAV